MKCSGGPQIHFFHHFHGQGDVIAKALKSCVSLWVLINPVKRADDLNGGDDNKILLSINFIKSEINFLLSSLIYSP